MDQRRALPEACASVGVSVVDALAASRRSFRVIVKASLDGDTRKTRISPTFTDLKGYLAKTFDSAGASARVTYVDEDGDNITVASDLDFEEAMSAVPQGKALCVVLKLASSPMLRDEAQKRLCCQDSTINVTSLAAMESGSLIFIDDDDLLEDVVPESSAMIKALVERSATDDGSCSGEGSCSGDGVTGVAATKPDFISISSLGGLGVPARTPQTEAEWKEMPDVLVKALKPITIHLGIIQPDAVSVARSVVALNRPGRHYSDCGDFPPCPGSPFNMEQLEFLVSEGALVTCGAGSESERDVIKSISNLQHLHPLERGKKEVRSDGGKREAPLVRVVVVEDLGAAATGVAPSSSSSSSSSSSKFVRGAHLNVVLHVYLSSRVCLVNTDPDLGRVLRTLLAFDASVPEGLNRLESRVLTENPKWELPPVAISSSAPSSSSLGNSSSSSSSSSSSTQLEAAYSSMLSPGYQSEDPLPSSIPGLKPSTVLLSFQEETVAWMRDREDDDVELFHVPVPLAGGLKLLFSPTANEATFKVNQFRGGINCEEMGLGKTVEVIALLLLQLAKQREAGWKTLIVVPVALLQQWKGELNEHVEQGALQLCVLDGSDLVDITTIGSYANADVVLTTVEELKLEKSLAVKTLKQDLANELRHDRPQPFGRLVVDEAHATIGGFSAGTNCFKLIQELTRPDARRWLLSGTPANDDVGSMRVLMELLGVDPFSRKTFWEKAVGGHLAQGEQGYSDQEVKQIMRDILRHITMRHVQAQRSTSDGIPLTKLPARAEKVTEEPFSEKESLTYEFLEVEAREMVARNEESGGKAEEREASFLQCFDQLAACGANALYMAVVDEVAAVNYREALKRGEERGAAPTVNYENVYPTERGCMRMTQTQCLQHLAGDTGNQRHKSRSKTSRMVNLVVSKSDAAVERTREMELFLLLSARSSPCEHCQAKVEDMFVLGCPKSHAVCCACFKDVAKLDEDPSRASIACPVCLPGGRILGMSLRRKTVLVVRSTAQRLRREPKHGYLLSDKRDKLRRRAEAVPGLCTWRDEDGGVETLVDHMSRFPSVPTFVAKATHSLIFDGGDQAGDMEERNTKMRMLGEALREALRETNAKILVIGIETAALQSLTTAATIAEACTDASGQVIKLFGCSKNELGHRAKSFQCDASVRVGLLPYGSCFGLNLTAATHNILLSASESAAVEEQALGRSIRIGSPHGEIKIVRLVVKGTEDERRTSKRRRTGSDRGGVRDPSEMWQMSSENNLIERMRDEHRQKNGTCWM